MAHETPTHAEGILSRRFGVAWVFLLVSATLGLLLRAMTLHPIDVLVFGHVLHAHSHVAFLGWVFNAFFVAALRHFIPADRARSYDRIWWAMQIAVLGMLATFPAQGYAPASIAFSTLHMGASAVFAWKLWHGDRAAPEARLFLRVALVCVLVSGLGPLALGPLAALDLRHSPAYPLSIYFYLHFQFNGWFVFFLLALWLQRRSERGDPVPRESAMRAGPWLVVGCVLTFALSALWLSPPAWVQAIGLLGAVLQVVGLAHLLRGTGSARRDAPGGVSRILVRLAVGSLMLKFLLQLLSAIPGLGGLASQRFVVIAFLHLVFLGFVTPALMAWATENGWLRRGALRTSGMALVLAGTAVTEIVLIAPTLGALAGWPLELPIREVLAGAAGVIVLGIAMLGAVLQSGQAASRSDAESTAAP